MFRDLPSKHDGDDLPLSYTYTLNSTRFAPEDFKTYSFLLATSAVSGPVAQPQYACVQVRMYCRVGWLPMRWCIRIPAMLCFRWPSALSVCTLRRKELEVWLNGWMRGWMSLVTCVKEYCFVSWCNVGSHGTMLYLLSSFSFSPKQSGCPTGFCIHSTRRPYELSFDFDVVRISLLCLRMALVKHIVGNLLFLDAAFREVLEKKSPRKR
jgi:hypothetical protein